MGASATFARLFRRWGVLVLGVVASLLPASFLALCFAERGYFVPTLLAVWAELLVGPVKYWLPVLLGHPSPYALHPMAGLSTWVYLACLPFLFAHPARPGRVTACLTGLAFCVWYGWASLAIMAYEY